MSMSITHATHLHTRLCWRTSALPCIPILHCVLPPPYRHDVAVLLQASLAAGMVDAVLIPEVAFTLEGEGGLLAYLEKIMEEKVGGAGRGGDLRRRVLPPRLPRPRRPHPGPAPG